MSVAVPASDVEVLSADQVPAWHEGGCPVCGELQHNGPEGTGWYNGHCWRCGYNPTQSTSSLPGAPQQPDWERLIRDAVKEAMFSEPQKLAEAMTAALGPQGMAELAKEQQANLGMAPGQ